MDENKNTNQDRVAQNAGPEPNAQMNESAAPGNPGNFTPQQTVPGAPGNPAPQQAAQGVGAKLQNQMAAMGIKTPKKLSNKMLILIIAAAAVLFIAMATGTILFLTNLGKTTVDMSKYYEIEVKGFNGYAKASVSELLDPYEDLYSEGKLDSDKLGSAVTTYAFFSDLSKELNKKEKISNGDTIELKFTYNKERAKKLKLKIKNTTLKLKVKGLEDGKKIDPFAGLEVKFTGISPNGKAAVSNNNSDAFIRKIRYSLDKESRLKNGDVIVVTASFDEEYAFENGYVVSADTKEYTVSGLGAYLDDKTTVSAENKAAFEKEFKDRMDSLLASEWDTIYNKLGKYTYGGEKVSVGSPKLEKGYLLSVKDPDKAFSDYNKLVIIYQVEINVKSGSSFSTGEFGSRTGYAAVTFSDAGIDSEGIFVNTPSSNYSGYSVSASMDSLVNDLVTAEKSNYIVTDWK